MELPQPQPPKPPERQTFAQIVRRYWWVILLSSALIVGVVISTETSQPSNNLTTLVDRLAEERDCITLQEIFDNRSVADELSYIDDAMRAAGCYRD